MNAYGTFDDDSEDDEKRELLQDEVASPHGAVGRQRLRAILQFRERASRSSIDLNSHLDNDVQTPNLDSFDYTEHSSLVSQIHRQRRDESQESRETLTRWGLTFAVAIETALLGFLVLFCTQTLVNTKLKATQGFLDNGWDFLAFLCYCGINMGLVFSAALLVAFVEPCAAGSGIPEIKCILNGLKIPRALGLKALVCKIVGVICAVSGAMPCGKEGPMIHSGAVCGAAMSSSKSKCNPCDQVFKPFRNDKEQRDFVSAGAAAGVACAFGAPIGGVLFTLEEGASFWNQELTWRTFFCAMSSTFILNMFVSAIRPGVIWGHFSQPGMLVFGDFESQNAKTYSLVDVPYFLILGVIGGVVGALYNELNCHLTKFRQRFLPVEHPRRRVLEACLICFLVSAVAFGIPYLSSDSCIPLGKESLGRIRFTCAEDEFHEMASLLLASSENAIKLLFHSNIDFSLPSLLCFFFLYYILSCLTYGLALPSGLFVPNLLAGAAFGRFIGELLHVISPWETVNAGTYALIGAAAVLGGMARMTISLTVILLEATGDIQYGLPIMLTLLAAKWSGDCFNEGLYDIHIHLRKLPFLHWEPDSVSVYLHAMDVMNPHVVYAAEVCTVRAIYEMLKRSRHKAFPIVCSEEGSDTLHRKFRGIIQRNHLVCILKNKDFYASRPVPYKNRPQLEWNDLEEFYQRNIEIEDIHLVENDLFKWVDLTPYMNPSPYVIQDHSPVSHAFALFRTMGLRHLCVVNKENQIVGMITRKDLTTISFHKQLHELFSPQPNSSSPRKYNRIDSPTFSDYSESSIDRQHERPNFPFRFVRNLDAPV